MIDSQKLMEEIDSLDNDINYETSKAAKVAAETVKEKKNNDVIKDKTSSDKANLILILIFLVMIISVIVYSAVPSREKEREYDEVEMNTEYEYVQVGEDGKVTMYSTDLNDENDVSKSSIDLNVAKSNIIVENSFYDVEKKLNFLIRNDNDFDISDISVEVAFYDGTDKLVEIDRCDIDLLPSKEKQYVCFDETPELSERYDVLISVAEYEFYNYKSHIEDVTFECVVNKEDEEIIIKGKNNSNDVLDVIAFEIIYYDKENKILKVKEAYDFDVKRNRSFEIEEYMNLYDSETYDEIPYDRYEIRLKSAYSY